MKAKDVLNLLKISRVTLSSYVKQGILKVTVLPNGYYDYHEDSIYTFLNKKMNRKNVIYARVSTKKQQQDLENQKDTIYTFAKNNGIKIEDSYSDIASGMNYDRKDFNRLIDDVISFKIDTIYISYKDRFSRIAFEPIEKLFNSFGTRIVILSDIGITKDTEKEFIHELIAMIHSFSMRMYSTRRKRKLELISKDLELESEI
jgi:putative resolvase